MEMDISLISKITNGIIRHMENNNLEEVRIVIQYLISNKIEDKDLWLIIFAVAKELMDCNPDKVDPFLHLVLGYNPTLIDKVKLELSVNLSHPSQEEV